MAKFSSTNQPKKQGRHPGRTVSDWIRLIAKSTVAGLNPINGEKENLTGNQVVAIKLFQKIWQDEDLGAMKEWIDRTEGKVEQKITQDINHNIFIETAIAKLETMPNRIEAYATNN